MKRFLHTLRCAPWLLLLASASALAAPPSCPSIGVAPASLPNGVISTNYDQALSATSDGSAFTPSAFSLRGGQLPTGLTLNASGNLTGTPTATGAFEFAVAASDAASCEGGRIYSVTIACGLFTISAPPHAVVGNAYSQTLAASGGVAPYTYTLSGTSPLLPANLVLAANGTLSGTPQTGTGGSYALLVDVADATSCTGAPVPVTLAVDEAPAITSANATTFTVGTSGSFSVVATGYPAPTLTIGGATLPTGVSFDAPSGTLSGTPAAGTAGTYALTFTATNGTGAPAVQTFTLTVNELPAITSANTTTFTVGTAGTFTVTATGHPVPALSESGALPSGVTFNAAAGVLSGTPAVGSGGSYSITFTATNSVGPANQVFTLVVDEAPAFTSANTTAFALGATGTFTVTASGHPAPTLSLTSGALPSGVTFTAATGVLSGTPAAGSGGSYALTFTATNGVGTNATQSFTLAVTDGAAITSANTTTFTVGSAGTFTVTATGSPAPTLSESGALPAGVTFNAATGVLSGTPAAGTGGSHAITFTATNLVGSPATQAFTLIVNEAPAITSANTTTFAIGVAGTFSVIASGHPTPTFGVAGALPSGVTFNAATGVLSGTPAASGTYALTFTATNGVGADATQAFTLNVTQPPAITSANTTTFTAGSAGAFTVTATGSPAPTLSESGALPAGVTFNAATGQLSGTPAAGTGGSYALTFTATNGIGSPATQAFTLIVNEAPAFTSANTIAFTVGTAGSFTVTASGHPAPALSLTGALPSGVTFTAATGKLAGTPAAGTGGSYALTFTATNGVGTNATQSFTLAVTDAPAITSANTTTFTAGSAGTFTVTATGTPTPTLSESGALPAGVTFNAATGVLSGTPAAGTGGSYALTFTATNLVGSPATQAFTLIVNEAPAITSANTTAFTVGTAGSFIVTANGHPAPALSLTGGALPSGVTFTAATGTLAGTPAAGTGGSYALTFTAANGVGANATQGFTLVVKETPAITSANTTTFTVGSAGTFTVIATGSPAPTLSESGALPSGVTFSAATGVLSGTPAVGSGGSYPITFTATNSVGPATQAFTLIVNEAPAFTSANTTAFTVGTAGSFIVIASGHPVPALSLTGGTLPSGVTFSAATGTLAGTPAAGTGGSYALTFTAANGVGANATQGFTLVVNEAPAITSANTTTFTVGSAGTFTLTATGSPAPTLSESGALPSGVTFNAATGVLSGTPAAGTGGSRVITFTATNLVGSPATQAFTLIINEAPAITSANTTTFAVGTAGSFTVTASGYPLPTLSESGALPNGITFNAATGALSGTATANGSYALTFTAANGIGTNATQTFTLLVNQPPAITSANTTTFTVGTAGSFPVTATGYPASTFSESGALPTGVTLTPAGLLSGTPAASSGGSYPITITATNGVNPPAPQSFTLIVNEAPQLTAPTGTTLTFPIGSPTSIGVTGTGYPKPGLSETGALPGGVTFADGGNGSGTLSGTPLPGSAGTYPISLTASNGIGSPASQAFTLTVTCPTITVSGTLPTALYQTAYGAQTFTQSGGAGTPAWSASGLPAGLTIGAADGKVSGTPTTTTSGVSVGITATDVNQCTGTLTVNPFKVLPVAAPDTFSTYGNTQLFIGVQQPLLTPYVYTPTKLTDNDKGPGTLILAVVAAPSHGTLGSIAGGAFAYTPTPGYSGADTFTYTVLDGNGVLSTPATVTINLGQIIWYVNGSVGVNGDGGSATPFNTLTSASTAHAANAIVFVESVGLTATITPGAITLKAGATLWGQGTDLRPVPSLSFFNAGAMSKPRLTGTVTIGGNNTTVSSLDITSSASTGFTNSGAVTGVTVKNDVAIATTTGTALSLTGASGDFTFRSISAGTAAAGPTNGIMLNTSSVLTVLGDGTTGSCSSATPTCSGGTIQHTGGDGISLTSAGVKLSLMAIQNNANSGIKGQGVSTLALTDLLVQNNTNGTGEQAGILINDLSDSAATVTRAQVSGSTEDNVRIHNSAAIGTIVFDACTIKDNSTASGNNGLFLQTNNSAKLTGTVQNSILNGNRSITLSADAGDASTLSATFKNNTITSGSPNQGYQGIQVSRAGTSALTFNIDGNTVTNLPNTLINVFSGGGAGTATGDVKNNTLTGIGAGVNGNQVGLRIFNSGSLALGFATMNVNVAGNTVNAIDGAYPILAESSGTTTGSGGALKIALTGNTANVAAPGAITSVDAIRVQARNASSICARISGNTTNTGGNGFYGMQVRQANTSVFNMEGLTGGAQTDPTVRNYVIAQNPAAASVGATMGTLTGVPANSCGITP